MTPTAVADWELPAKPAVCSELHGPDDAIFSRFCAFSLHGRELALAAIIAAGVAGITDGARLPDPIQQDPGSWSHEQRAAAGIVALPATPDGQREALLGNARISAVLGEPLLGAFLAVRASDAAWARDREPEQVLAAHLWRH